MAANDFVILTNLINKFGLSGEGSNRFVTKNDLIDFGEFDQRYFNNYRAGEFVREKDIKIFNKFSITPNFLVDLNNAQNTANSLFDEINSLQLTPRSGTPNVTITTKDGFRCLKSNVRGNQNVYQLAYSSVPTAIKNALISGNFTVVTFLALPSSESNRWGISCFYNKSQLTSGWMTNDFKSFTNIMTAKWNTGHFAFNKGEKTNIGMMAYAVDRSGKKIRYTNQPSTVYSPNLNITEIAFTGDVTSGNGMSQIGGSQYLQIGKSQESSYFMSTNCYFQALAIFTRALSTTELQNIHKYKSLKSTYKTIEYYRSQNLENTPKQLSLFQSFDYNEEFAISVLTGAKLKNTVGGNITTLIYACDNTNNPSLEIYYNETTDMMYLNIYHNNGQIKTIYYTFSNILGVSLNIIGGLLTFGIDGQEKYKLYTYINPITKFYFLMNPNDSTRTGKISNNIGGGMLVIQSEIPI